VRGLAHPFRDGDGRPSFGARGRVAQTLLAAWQQIEDEGYEPVRWLISRRLAVRLAREEHSGALRDDLPARLFDMPAELSETPVGFGIVVRQAGQ
jgi:hypothetical protein